MKKSILFYGLLFCFFSFLTSEELKLSVVKNKETKKMEYESLPGSTEFSTRSEYYLYRQSSVFGDRTVKQVFPLSYNNKIKVFNLSYDEDIDIDIYGYNTDTKEWDYAGNCLIQLDGNWNDAEGVSAEIKDPFENIKKAKLKNYWLFSVVSKNGHLYECQVSSASNDLYIFLTKRLDTIYDDYKSDAYIIDMEALEKFARQSIEIENKTKIPMTFEVYGFVDLEDEDWTRVWTTYVKEKDDEDLKGPYFGQLLGYKYFAIRNKEGKNVNYEARVSGKKLAIVVR